MGDLGKSMQVEALGSKMLDEGALIAGPLSYAMMGVGVLVALLLQCQTAPYGRYANSARSGSAAGPDNGYDINPRLGWLLQELPAFLIPLYLYSKSTFDQTVAPTINFILILMFISHYFQRTFIYSILIRGGKPIPVTTFGPAIIFCSYNGYLQGQYLAKYAVYQESWAKDPRFILGCAIFLAGLFVNLHSDYILRNLRKPGETGYKIPQGGMFEYVSGANFFGEMLEWSGFALASWSVPAFSFAFFSLCNIGPRGCHHHRYYLEKFDDYPKNRKAIIPFLW